MLRNWLLIGSVSIIVITSIGCKDDGSCPPGLVRMGEGCVPGDAGACMDTEVACDGYDNDCDGTVDEDLTRACGMDVGACTAGVEVCTMGVWGECSGIVAVEEDCNLDGDEDCDGMVDEGCGPCAEGSTRGCGTDVGVCDRGTQVCLDDGTWEPICTGGTSPGTETCNGTDDDCDGTTDEDTAGASCGTDVGVCMSGVERCVGGTLECDGGVMMGDETCNGLDDDCDGTTDEGVATAYYPDVDGDGKGDADATPMMACDMPAGFVDNADDCDDACDVCFTGASEVCDGEDNDCNGTADTDAGFACTAGAATSCSTACGSTGSGTCTASCDLPTGAACAPPAELCDYADSDCDGLVDEGVGSFGMVQTPPGNDVDDVRLVATRNGFALFRLSGASILVQRLSSSGVPEGNSVTIDNGGCAAFDVAVVDAGGFVVAWRELDTVKARLVTLSTTNVFNMGPTQIIYENASALVGIAVAASTSKVFFAMGDPQGDLYLAKTGIGLVDPVGQEVISPTKIPLQIGAGFRQVELNESSGVFTIAWEHSDNSVGFGRIEDGFGLSVQDKGTLVLNGDEPILADDGAGNRVAAFVGSSGLQTWYLDSGSWTRRGTTAGGGIPVPYAVTGSADTGTFRRAAAAYSGGKWLFVSHLGSTIRVTEVDDRGNVLNNDTFSASPQGLDIAARPSGESTVAVGTSASTQSALYGCP